MKNASVSDERGRNPRSHFPGKKRSERSGSQSASSTFPHNPAHSRNSIIQLSFPAKPMLEYGSWGHFGHAVKEEEEEDLADGSGRHGHVSQWSAARFFSVSALHALSSSSLRPPPSFPSLLSSLRYSSAERHQHLNPPQNKHTQRVYINNLQFQHGTVRFASITCHNVLPKPTKSASKKTKKPHFIPYFQTW